MRCQTTKCSGWYDWAGPYVNFMILILLILLLTRGPNP